MKYKMKDYFYKFILFFNNIFNHEFKNHEIKNEFSKNNFINESCKESCQNDESNNIKQIRDSNDYAMYGYSELGHSELSLSLRSDSIELAKKRLEKQLRNRDFVD